MKERYPVSAELFRSGVGLRRARTPRSVSRDHRRKEAEQATRQLAGDFTASDLRERLLRVWDRLPLLGLDE